MLGDGSRPKRYGESGPPALTPVAVPNVSGIRQLPAGSEHVLALTTDGRVLAWGSNWHSQFGNGERSDLPSMKSGWELTPRQVPGVVNVAAISVGITGRHTLALLKDGTLRGWGNTDWGQIGAGVSGQFQPRPVTPKISGVKLIFDAGNNSFAVRQDNSLWAWGLGGPMDWPLPANTKLPAPLALK
jgi:alpha-tubulin suppressor-like RCC1 family protein